jgi:site-specific recombinase XerD
VRTSSTERHSSFLSACTRNSRASAAKDPGAVRSLELVELGLRHTFASHLVMRGVALKAVQELLGHATIDMTIRYAHLSADVKREAAQLLDAPPNGTMTALEAGT